MRNLFLAFFIFAFSDICHAKIYPQVPEKTFVVVLDAGHGGKDPGATGSSESKREKDINLAITLEVGRLLQNNQKDIKVVYTRKTDVFLELGQRASIANKQKADLFVSIHTNSQPKDVARKARGVQTYTLCLSTASTNLEVEKRENSVVKFEKNKGRDYNYNSGSEADIIYEIMQERDMRQSVAFAKIVQRQMVNYAGRNDKGVRQADLAVLRLTYMPSVLVEVGYISTPEEEDFLMSNAGRNKMAMAIYKAIVEYKKQQK